VRVKVRQDGSSFTEAVPDRFREATIAEWTSMIKPHRAAVFNESAVNLVGVIARSMA
jgi:hypothetical protein